MDPEQIIIDLATMVNGLLVAMDETEDASCLFCHSLVGLGQPHTAECVPAHYLYELGVEIDVTDDKPN